jgi:hypothetical protein
MFIKEKHIYIYIYHGYIYSNFTLDSLHCSIIQIEYIKTFGKNLKLINVVYIICN